MNFSRIFILRPVATTLLMAAILMAGIVGYRDLPVSALPEVDYPTIQVVTFYPGASPDVMASSVTAPLERQFGQVPGLNQMTSNSSYGSSLITLQFELNLNIDVAEQEVQAAINAGSTYLPADLPNPPVYSKTNPADAPILTLALTSDVMPLASVEDLADTRLGPRISQVPGVGLVSIGGGQKPAVRIQANPTQLAAYGISIDQLRTTVAAANVNQAKGSFDGAQRAYTIDDNDQLLTSEDYKPLIVYYHNGAPVRLSDVANVVDSAENVQEAAWMNSSPAVILNVQRQPGANIITVVDQIKKLLPTLQTSLPASVHVAVLTDRTTTIRASVRDVQFELMLTIVLVVAVIFLFLRSLSATVIPSIAVPLSIVGTFGVMYLLGYSLNNLTLMAMTISTGFVVDDAIVMIENISRFIEEGEAPLAAALKGSKQIGFTIMSLTISLIAVLIPLLFMGDIVGRLFREFAITLAVTILISAIVSLTLTPMMSAKLLRFRPAADQGWFYGGSERIFKRTIERYGGSLQWVLRHQTATLLIAIATLVLTIVLYIVVPKGFFPVQDTGVIQAITEAPQDTSFDRMVNLQQSAAKTILSDPAVESLSSFIGIDGTNVTLNSGRLLINLKPLEVRKVDVETIIARLQTRLADIPGIMVYLQPVQDLTVEDRTSRTQYQYTLEDPNSAQLYKWAPKLVDKLKQLPQLTDVASDQQDSGLQAELVIDRATASRLGITPAEIDSTLYDAFGQRQISTIFTQLNQYHAILEVSPHFQKNPKQLSDIYIPANSAAASASGTSSPTAPPATSGGNAPVAPNEVPLSAITHVELQATPLVINHQGQFPVVTVSFDVAPAYALGDAVSAIERAQAELGMPASIEAAFQGTAQAFRASLTNEPILILAAMITVYIVLGVLYESYIHPITILSTLPSAGVGAILALLICGEPLNIIALIGIILLIGIVKKNAIMMIDFALEAQRTEGRSAEDAIYQACLLRFRPIMMTTMAALLGGLPLALGTGVGSELRRPLGITIVGGLLLSQVLTLYTTPVIFLAFERLASRLKPATTARRIRQRLSQRRRVMNLSEPFIRNSVGTTLLTIAIVLAGVVAFRLLPVSPLPQVDFPTIQVSAGLPGASSEVMASAVAAPLERQFGHIAGLTEMTSSSSLGSASVTLQFDLSRNIDAAARDVQAAINAARGQLPTNLPSNPTYKKVNPADSPITIMALTSETLDQGQMYDAASSILAQKLSQIEGVGQVTVGGSALPAVRVELNPIQLHAYGIGLEQVRSVLAAANSNSPKGALSDSQTTYQIGATDQLLKADQYKPLIIHYHNGAPVHLSDVAQVIDSVQDVRNQGLSDGQPAVLIIVFRQPGANIIDTVDRIRAAMPQLEASIPPAIHVAMVLDQTVTIRASVRDVEITLLISILLVVLVVYAFLRSVRATAIPGLAVPISLIGTFGVMYLFGYSLDNLSLMALTISTGFVVDDAIVVVENISRYIEQGYPPFQAAVIGAKTIAFTVISISVSLIAVFIPILLMGGLVGRLFREFAVTLSAAIVVSLIISLTTTPMMAAKLLRPYRVGGDGTKRANPMFDRLLHGYERSLGWVLRHAPLMLGVALGTVALSVYLFIIIPKGFFPQQDNGRLMGAIMADQGTSFQEMERLLHEYAKGVKSDPAVQHVIGFAGSNAGATNTARMFITLKPLNERGVSADEVIDRLRKKLAHIAGGRLYLQASQDVRVGGRMSNAQYQYTVQSTDLDEVNKWAPQLLTAMRHLPQLTDVNSDQQENGPDAYLAIDRTSAARLGLTPSQIDNTLYDAFGQRLVSTMYTPLNQYYVVMEAAPEFWQNPSTLNLIHVDSAGGGEVPLSAFTHYTATTTPITVNHQGQFPSVTISFNLALNVPLSAAVTAIQRAEDKLGMPADINGSFQGTAQAFQASLSSEPMLILAALISVYIVLGILYESYIHPITIISTLPSAGVGALLALMLCGTELTVIALIGMFLLIGIVKKNAILMVDFALEAERNEHKTSAEAIYEACLLRFRPIMMTTMAAALGGLPLALGTGMGSELRRPLGITIVGGLIASQAITLYTTPVIYLYLDRLRLWIERKRSSIGSALGSRTGDSPA